jgi:FG-GAP-like repeat
MNNLPARIPIFPALLPTLCLAATIASAQPLVPTFQRDDRPATASARGIAVADLNRDGWVDVVTANHGPDGIAILLSQGRAGGFTPSFIPIAGGPFDVAIGDLDGDGAPDIAVAAPDSTSIVVVFARPGGGFTAPVKVANSNSRGLTIGDVDGDGNLDLVYTLWDAAGVQVLNGNRHGAFTARIAPLAVGINPQGVAAADFNLDGRMDLAVASSGSVGISILSQTSPGTFTRSDVRGPVSQNVIVAADLDRDGRPDIAAASTGTSEVTVYEVHADNSTTLLVYQSGGSSPRGIAAADLNRDGATDLIVAARGTNTAQVLFGNGNGTFAQPAVGFAAGAGSRAVAVADFDNDGRLDLATANEFSPSVTTLSNTTAFTKSAFAFSRSVVGGSGNGFGGFSEADLADFDRDGRRDIVTQGRNGGLTVIYGNGSSIDLPTLPVGPRSIRAIDVNGDAVPDIVYLDSDTDSSFRFRIEVYLGKRTGGFTAGPSVGTLMNGFTLTAADLNRDGKLDLVAAGFAISSGDRPMQVFLGAGDGTFTLASQPAMPPSSAWAAIGDINRDGFPDIVTTSSSAFANSAGVVRVWPNDGTGHFASASQTVEIPEFQGISGGSLGDLNHDGYLDLVAVGSRSGPQFREVFTVMPGGASGLGAPVITAGLQSRMFLADLTMDGNLDAFSEDGHLAAGRGDGTFDPPLGFEFFAAGLRVIDFNRDGLPDIVSGFSAGTAQVILNLHRDNNLPPTVEAGGDMVVSYTDQFSDADREFEPVGSDPDLHALAWEWRDQSGAVVSDQPFFGPGIRNPGTYTYTVTVTDGRGGSASDSVRYTVTPDKEVVTHVGAIPSEPHGTWASQPDATAASGLVLRDTDLGQPKVTAPSANPTNYVEFLVPVDPTQTYKLWVRLKATNDSFTNDSLWLQFDNAVDQNGRSFAPGTTSGIEVVLEECSGCGESGWGWRDDAWGQRGAMSALTLRFTRGGYQRVRIQTREDGVSIDQLVLSAEQYLTTRPGTVKNDTTILPATGRE